MSLEPPETVGKLQRVLRVKAKECPDYRFYALYDKVYRRDVLIHAYERCLQNKGAAGVDGQTWANIEKYGVSRWLDELVQELREKTYRPEAVRRVWIPKSDGQKRPLGIPTLRDRVVQMAVVLVIEPIFDEDLQPEQHAYRADHDAHKALREVQTWLDRGYREIVDADLSGYFDTLDHIHLRELLRRRVRDGVLLRLIDKWLKAGVLEDGTLTIPDKGSPQGGVISPFLANEYLHYVLDIWFEQEVKPRLTGRAFLIRYADDFVIGFTNEADARRVLDVLPKRFGRYGLTIHPDKTKLVPFRSPAASAGGGSGKGPSPGTFDLLGFTHFWSRSRKGNWVVKRRTAADRLRRAIRRIADWCRLNRHRSIADQHQILGQKLRGHFAYYGITGNGGALQTFRDAVLGFWRKWLSRRSRGSQLSWDYFNLLLKCAEPNCGRICCRIKYVWIRPSKGADSRIVGYSGER